MKQKDKVVIVFESVWNHTQEMAEALAEGFADAGKELNSLIRTIYPKAIIM